MITLDAAGQAVADRVGALVAGATDPRDIARFGAALGQISALGGSHSRVVAMSSDRQLEAADHRAVLLFTAPAVLTLLSAVEAGQGFAVRVALAADTGSVTIDPFGGQTVGGRSTHRLGPREAAELVCDGSSWIVVGAAGIGRSKIHAIHLAL